jgi:hypothetical protein
MITFTSNAEVPASGDWYGIKVYDSGSQVTLRYSTVEYHTYGIHASGSQSSNPVMDLVVEDSVFRSGEQR